MSFSLTRLTLYGVLSSIDNDLRELVKSRVGVTRGLREIVGPELFFKVKQRAETDGATEEQEFLEYLDFGDSIQILQKHSSLIDETTRKMVKNCSKALQQLAAVRNRVMHARPLQFSDVTMTNETATTLLSYPQDLFRNLRNFTDQVRSDPNFPFTLDITELPDRREAKPHNLPIPDFDETGFLGREQECKQLLGVCKGPWPIITVVGEGGFGKTALALKTAYELLDDPASPFDAFVWTSSKTTRLSLNDIQNIEGAISDSLGIFKEASRVLTGSSSPEAALQEVIQYLNEFCILLIIDNLETVLDKRMLDFFAKLNGRSKVLITSRLGTGEMNYRFPLSGLSEVDSLQLLRATAKVRRVPDLVAVKNESLRGYCARMKFNPGFIKWFVSAVQCGRRPEDVLANPQIFLDFCLSNVYEYVGDDARKIAKAMLAVPGKHTQAVLSYITKMDGDRFQAALQQLWSANLVSMLTTPTETGFETVYELSELPRLYILKNHPPTAQEVALFQQTKREITLIHERLEADRYSNRYDSNHVVLRTKHDTVVAKYLIDALAESSKGAYDNALAMVEKARSLDPAYYEVHRVEALIQNWSGNYAAALGAFEIAIDCEPKSAPLHYWYGGFLLRDAQDVASARKEFEIGISLDGSAPQLRAELARSMMYMGDFDLADSQLIPLCESADLATKLRRKCVDLLLQVAVRRAGKCLDHGDFEKALQCCRDATKRFKSVDEGLIDDKILETVRKVIPILHTLEHQLTRGDIGEQVRALLDEVEQFRVVNSLNRVSPRISPLAEEGDIGREFVGRVVEINSKRFGFIEFGENNRRAFFHFSKIVGRVEDVHLGDVVNFELER